MLLQQLHFLLQVDMADVDCTQQSSNEKQHPSDDEVAAAVREYMESADVYTVTRKQLIEDLSSLRNWDLSDKKVELCTFLLM